MTTLQEAPATEVGIGSVFYTSWGYDQTNVNFYKVVEVSKTGKTIKLVQICGTVAEIDGRRGVIPLWSPEAGGYKTYQPPQWCQACYKRLDGYGDSCECETPVPPAQPVFTKRIKSWNGEPTLNWNSYSNAYLWDGVPKFDTTALGYAGR